MQAGVAVTLDNIVGAIGNHAPRGARIGDGGRGGADDWNAEDVLVARIEDDSLVAVGAKLAHLAPAGNFPIGRPSVGLGRNGRAQGVATAKGASQHQGNDDFTHPAIMRLCRAERKSHE